MKKFYDSLCEKDKRRYAAIESEKSSHGGVNYISTLLGKRLIVSVIHRSSH